MSTSHVLDAFDLSGAVALVTGGGSGLGRAIAVGLSQVGASVAVIGRRLDPIEETVSTIEAAGGTAMAVQSDITNEGAPQAIVDRVVEHWGRIDILVNCAGVTVVKPSVDLTFAEWDRIVDTNLKAAFFCSAAAARRYLAQGEGGVILNIASVGALQGGSGVYTAYSASKGGLVSLTRAQASEWGRQGIRVNCIAAGAFHTEMSAAAYEDPDIHDAYVRRIPLGRTAVPGEIAPLAVYLASSASSFVTGEVFVIDGGQVMR